MCDVHVSGEHTFFVLRESFLVLKFFCIRLIKNCIYEVGVKCVFLSTCNKVVFFVCVCVFQVGKGRAARSSSATSTTIEGIEDNVGGDDDNGEHGTQDVLVIPFTPNVGESVGLIAEQKVSMTVVIVTISLHCCQSHH